MKDLIELYNRSGYKHYLTKVPDLDKTYKLNLDKEALTIRVGKVPESNKIMFIDPPGGPYIGKDDKILEADAVVKEIKFIANYGYCVVFK